MTARIYLRISRPDEARILENQRATAIQHAAAIGYPDPTIYDENAPAGDKSDRPVFTKMMGELRPGDLVIFSNLSRMTRGGISTALEILRQIETKGAGWHFIETPSLNFDSGASKLTKDILFSVLAALAEDYRRRISEATKAVYERKKAASLASGGKLHWGRSVGEKPRRCRFCGRASNAGVHSPRHHQFERGKPGPGCVRCGMSPKARVHISGHHPYNPAPRLNGGGDPPQAETSEINRDDL